MALCGLFALALVAWAVYGLSSYGITLTQGRGFSDMTEVSQIAFWTAMVIAGLLMFAGLCSLASIWIFVSRNRKDVFAKADTNHQKVVFIPDAIFMAMMPCQFTSVSMGEGVEPEKVLAINGSIVAFGAPFAAFAVAAFIVTFGVILSVLGDETLSAIGIAETSAAIQLSAGTLLVASITGIAFLGHRTCRKIEVA